MLREIVHPGWLASLADVFLQKCTIQTATETRNAYQEPIQSWADLAGHVDLPCRLIDVGGREVPTTQMIYAVGTYTIALAGYYPAIAPAMRAVIGTAVFDVQHVRHSSLSKLTQLVAQVVT